MQASDTGGCRIALYSWLARDGALRLQEAEVVVPDRVHCEGKHAEGQRQLAAGTPPDPSDGDASGHAPQNPTMLNRKKQTRDQSDRLRPHDLHTTLRMEKATEHKRNTLLELKAPHRNENMIQLSIDTGELVSDQINTKHNTEHA